MAAISPAKLGHSIAGTAFRTLIELCSACERVSGLCRSNHGAPLCSY